MKIEVQDGCVCTGMYIDGTSISEMNEDQRHEVRKALCEYILNHEEFDLFRLGEIVVANADSEYSYSQPCECCGDCIETWKMEI
jgi:hypothetical protein